METKQEQDRNPLACPPKTKEKNLRPMADGAQGMKLKFPVALTKKCTEPETHKGYRGEPVGNGQSPIFGDRFRL